jgi:phenylacetate-coenzyme A ligase PaaK-like adenylate-forming protein
MQDKHNISSSYKYDQFFKWLPQNFQARALELFNHQYKENAFYHSFAKSMHSDPAQIENLSQIPFLPVSFFKSGLIKTNDFIPAIIFESSGTTGQTPARHAVKDTDLYRYSFRNGFELFYGDIKNYCILGLLPSYLERTGSSLVFMVDEMIKLSNHPDSGFYLYDTEKLRSVIIRQENNKQPTLLIGVSFALLDFAEKYEMKLSYTTVMETGGMKGRREELTRDELHEILKRKLSVSCVHSEYGMTELLSQAYADCNGLFRPVPWMKMLVRDDDDPKQTRSSGEGLLNIIDLANRDSCAFIATDDVVRLYEDGSFEVLGRMDNSDMRGCSLLLL